MSTAALSLRQKKIKIVLIKPSKYDDEGYVIRHFRGVLPSNTLACLSSLTQDVAKRGLLGPGTDLEVELIDDTVQKIPVKRIIRSQPASRPAHDRRPGRSPVQPVPAGGRSGEEIPGRRPAGPHRRIPRERHARPVRRRHAGDPGTDRYRRDGGQGRGGRDLGRHPAGCRSRPAETPVRFPGLQARHFRAAVAEGRTEIPQAVHRLQFRHHRLQPRLSVQLQLLLHHQRAGEGDARPLAGAAVRVHS